MAIYIDEFLYRGRPDGDPTPPAWHVILAGDAIDAFGQPQRVTQTLNMEQAAAAGWDLPAILGALNAATAAALDRANAQIADLQAQLAALTPPT